MTFSYTIWALIKPSQLILLAAIIGVVVWRTKVGRYSRVAAILMLLGLGLLPIGPLLIRPLEERFPLAEAPVRVDGIVVLAGAEVRDLSRLYGQPQLNAHGDRLTTFLMLASRYPDARLVHSGGGEMSSIRRLLPGAGIAADRILFDDRATNTCESPRTVRDLVQPDENEIWVVVSSAFHLPRAVACFRAIGWDIVPYPSDYQQGASPFFYGLIDNLRDLDLATHEWFGLFVYRVRGWTDELFPGPR